MPTGVAQPTEMELADEEQEEEGQEGQHAPPDFDDGPRPLSTGPLWLRLRFGIAGDADTNTGTDNNTDTTDTDDDTETEETAGTYMEIDTDTDIDDTDGGSESDFSTPPDMAEGSGSEGEVPPPPLAGRPLQGRPRVGPLAFIPTSPLSTEEDSDEEEGNDDEQQADVGLDADQQEAGTGVDGGDEQPATPTPTPPPPPTPTPPRSAVHIGPDVIRDVRTWLLSYYREQDARAAVGAPNGPPPLVERRAARAELQGAQAAVAAPNGPPPLVERRAAGAELQGARAAVAAPDGPPPLVARRAAAARRPAALPRAAVARARDAFPQGEQVAQIRAQTAAIEAQTAAIRAQTARIPAGVAVGVTSPQGGGRGVKRKRPSGGCKGCGLCFYVLLPFLLASTDRGVHGSVLLHASCPGPAVSCSGPASQSAPVISYGEHARHKCGELANQADRLPRRQTGTPCASCLPGHMPVRSPQDGVLGARCKAPSPCSGLAAPVLLLLPGPANLTRSHHAVFGVLMPLLCLALGRHPQHVQRLSQGCRAATPCHAWYVALAMLA